MRVKGLLGLRPICSVAGLLAASQGLAQDANLAQQLSNPVASLVSVPLQFNFDENIGPGDDGRRTTTNLQPVVPISLGEDWNLISRTILPYITQKDVTGPGKTQEGFGDIVQNFFLSPKAPTDSGWTWGAGAVLNLPTGSTDFSTDQFGLGPTAVALRQQSGWTYGILANHVWGVDPEPDDEALNATFLQPFLSYTTSNAWTFSLNTESTYDWNAQTWSVPVNAAASKLITLGGQKISLGLGIRHWAESPPSGPEGTGFRAVVTFLFPT